METTRQQSDFIDENQSLRIIREMIEVSRKKLKTDGILFILWGWICFVNCFIEYLSGVVTHTYHFTTIKHWLTLSLPILGIVFTLGYLYRQSHKATTYIGISLRYVWVSLFVAMVLINLIQFNVLEKIIFELQHPVFMVVTAFAIVVTGGIIRYKMIVAGGIAFALTAYICSYLSLYDQLLVESIAWLAAFIIPGHILYAQRKS